ncbi:AraC-like DNA-binding protein [Pedobacter cryoconitis]|uniref:AraC-like DNA-binding protein n=1 Tax=Pedobacter cryoconitis TaxID=188932 RepID=A0A7W8ZMQ2_9SPHI|nr:helix-turn-helix domain-containing protein [Pedobacter cryoconitis]MBB5636821.1 AraC-like DNA-binding protein [Pedobacter cryoconitis]MBB6271218.1 AraC-like DNA-binding protein [Pedobacter cryoconitis]
MKDIPVHKLELSTAIGVEVQYFEMDDFSDAKMETMGAHRDDHYLFFFIEEGHASIQVEFKERQFTAGSLYYVLPSQVHHRINNKDARGWILALDPALIPLDYANIFDHVSLLQEPYLLNSVQLKQWSSMLKLLDVKYNEDQDDPFYIPIVHAMVQLILAMTAKCFSSGPDISFKVSRPVEISKQFKRMVIENFKTIKSPSVYADRLNVSESYLNEVVKKVTGFPVSFWINQEIILEAKRQLYYSQLDIKGISTLLGYDDQSYFSRFFKKITGMSAIAFRAKYRK